MAPVMDGVKVIEVAIYAFVPAAGAVLADWGADVVKVEHPSSGDPLRGLVAYGVKPGDGGVTCLWEVLNRGKRSVGIDLATKEGLELLLTLVEGADVFLTNFLEPARQQARHRRRRHHGPQPPDHLRPGHGPRARSDPTPTRAATTASRSGPGRE